MENFCLNPSKETFSYLPYNTRVLLYKVSILVDFNMLYKKGNNILMNSIKYYFFNTLSTEEKKNLKLVDPKLFEAAKKDKDSNKYLGIKLVLKWREEQDIDSENGLYFSTVKPGIYLFRGVTYDYPFAPDRYPYFAVDIGNANSYLKNKIGKCVKKTKKECDKMISKGISTDYSNMIIYRVTKKLKLLNMDNVYNLNKLLRDFYYTDKEHYENFKKLIFSLTDLFKLEKGVQNNVLDFVIYGGDKSKRCKYNIGNMLDKTGTSGRLETDTTPLQISFALKNSNFDSDKKFSEWLCDNGFDGYCSDLMFTNEPLKGLTRAFPEEILLCKPNECLEKVRVINMVKTKDREVLNQILFSLGIKRL